MKKKGFSGFFGMAAVVAVFVGVLNMCLHVHAGKEEPDQFDFEINAQVLSSENETYNICVEIENNGVDWEGTARVYLSEAHYVPGAYDTVISLAQGSTKQFVVSVPKLVSDSLDGDVRIVLLDKKSKVVAEKKLKKLLMKEMECIAMGILSDSYASLTYLDMGGRSLYYYSSNLPIKLVELNQDSLEASLKTLTILVIDKYNTSVLTQEQKDALLTWINNGGMLIVGTGNYAQDTLGGLAGVIPEVTCTGVMEAGSIGEQGYIHMERTFDLNRLDVARLQGDMNLYGESYFTYGLNASQGRGAVSVLPYSLADLEQLDSSVYDDESREDYIERLLDDACSNTSSRYDRDNMGNIYDQASNLRALLGIVGNVDNTLHFGVLKFLIVVYVIFVGPILYLILRVAKKREIYWVCVPVAALLGVVVIYFAGRGFEVVDTKVYSVTTKNLQKSSNENTYLYCYNAGHREWDLKLCDGYEYAGALLNEEYGLSANNDLQYYHHIKKAGEELSFGINPSSTFEDCYFYAGKEVGNPAEGQIEFSNITADWSGVSGKITNHTDKAFPYFAVIVNDTLYVYKDLGAGETISVQDKSPLYTGSQGFRMRGEYIYDFLRNASRNKKNEEDIAALAALGVGISDACNASGLDAVSVCGVCVDWEQSVDDKCKEVSYGCLYTVK